MDHLIQTNRYENDRACFLDLVSFPIVVNPGTVGADGIQDESIASDRAI